MEKQRIIEFYNNVALKSAIWTNRNKYYHYLLEKYYSFIIPKGSKVLELGCGSGELLNAVHPSYGVGIDISKRIVEIAQKKFPDYKFILNDAENIKLNEKFDYIILSDLVGGLWDVQKVFHELKSACQKHTKIVISSFNYMWEPVLRLAETLKLKLKQPVQNWLSPHDIINLLNVEGYECIKLNSKILFPKRIPIISYFFNNVLANLPLFNWFCLTNFFIARLQHEEESEYFVSIIIPARNEKGNIENIVLRTPEFGHSMEFIFVEGNSSDGTFEEMLRIKEKYPRKFISVIKQTGIGKGNAVREGFEIAKGQILMILDADMTVAP
jgi:SAM-dependent methyltransferase